MNAFIRKEVRLLLPVWIIGFLLAFSIWLIPIDESGDSVARVWLQAFPLFICPAMVLMMALSSFGGELSAGTFSNLLAQPVSRARVWWTKTLLLAAGIATISCAWLISFLLHHPNKTDSTELRDFAVTAGLFALAVYSGGLWTVLLFRQVASAFWVMLLVPVALAVSITYIFENHSATIEPALIVGLSIYSIAGFIFARRMFLRAQDVQWAGAALEVPELRGLVKFTFTSGVKRIWRPRVALLAKEFQLHQSQFVMAGVLALLHLGVIVWRKFGGDAAKNSTMEFIFMAFWCLWLVMPLLVGCTAVAEERRFNTLESQLCLPVKHRTQFILKLGVVLFLSVLLGVMMPLLFEGTRIFPDLKFRGVMTMVAICASVGALSFYASTLGRNTLSVLAPAFVIIVVSATLLLNARRAEEIFGFPIWRGWLIYWIGVPVMALVLFRLAFWNYRRVLAGWKLLTRNFLVLAMSLAFVMTATSAIYHRAWEWLTPLEPAHGTARLTRDKLVSLRADDSTLTVQFSDGRVWVDQFGMMASDLFSVITSDYKPMEADGGGKFIEGSNWVSFAKCAFDLVGVRADGSLWVSEQPQQIFSSSSKTNVADWRRMMKFGEENEWKGVVGKGFSAFLLKKDGTLWQLGFENFDFSKRKRWPGLRTFEAQSLHLFHAAKGYPDEPNSDWTEIFSIGHTICFRKFKEQHWLYSYSAHHGQSSDGHDIVIGHSELGEFSPGGVASIRSKAGNHFDLGVRKDGTLRMPHRTHSPSGQLTDHFQIGNETNWTAISGIDSATLTLKSDGTLWKWDFSADPEANSNSATRAQFGTRSDWIAITDAMDGILTLAADGSLWLWRFEPDFNERRSYSSSTSPEAHRLLAISRKPQFIANIFGKQN